MDLPLRHPATQARPVAEAISSKECSVSPGQRTWMPYADLDDVRLHYEFDGPADKPVLALSSSLGTNLHMWDRVIASLTGEYRVLRYDMRGHGESSVPTGSYMISHLAEDFLSLADTLEIRQ